jgi:hypothetical protein
MGTHLGWDLGPEAWQFAPVTTERGVGGAGLGGITLLAEEGVPATCIASVDTPQLRVEQATGVSIREYDSPTQRKPI